MPKRSCRLFHASRNLFSNNHTITSAVLNGTSRHPIEFLVRVGPDFTSETAAWLSFLVNWAPACETAGLRFLRGRSVWDEYGVHFLLDFSVLNIWNESNGGQGSGGWRLGYAVEEAEVMPRSDRAVYNGDAIQRHGFYAFRARGAQAYARGSPVGRTPDNTLNGDFDRVVGRQRQLGGYRHPNGHTNGNEARRYHNGDARTYPSREAKEALAREMRDVGLMLKRHRWWLRCFGKRDGALQLIPQDAGQRPWTCSQN